MKTHIKKLFLKVASSKVRKKTKLSTIQSTELAETLIRTLYSMNGLRFWRNQLYARILLEGIDWNRLTLTEEKLNKLIPSPTYRHDYREPIGIWYTIDPGEDHTDAPKIRNNDRVTYYASGREPFLAIVNHISPERRVVLAPYFTCGTVYQPFQENDWEIVYYKVTRELKIDLQDVEEQFQKHRPSIAIFMEYSGMDLTDEELQTLGKLKQAGCVTIVDRSQNIYSDRRSEEVDFYCGSLRKWYPFPDGAYLEKNGTISLPPAPKADDYNDVYTGVRAAMMIVNRLADKTKIEQYLQLANFFHKFSASYICCQPVRIRSMSEYSKAVYLQEQQNDREYMQRRTENFRYIFHRISSFTAIRPVCSDYARFTSPPFYFHIYAGNRKKLISYLSSKGITTWINWNKAKHFGELDGQTEFIFRHILSLPCDQRYTQQDMTVMCDALEAYEHLYGKPPTG